MNKPIFSVDWEPWACLIPDIKKWNCDPLVEEPTFYLLDLLRRHQIKAVFYCLGWMIEKRQDLFLKIKQEGHVIGDHTYYHNKTECTPKKLSDPLFRSPRFYRQKRLYAGGFFLRAMPYWWLKRQVLKENFVFIHPHDILLEHPKLPNPLQNLKRQIGLETARDKLERLTREVEFDDATVVYKSAIARSQNLL